MSTPTIKESSAIQGLRIIIPSPVQDFRGEFVETFSAEKYRFKNDAGVDLQFVEDDISVSRKNVLRGMHGDKKTWKLVQCLSGAIYEVVIDMRKESRTYMNWEAFTLDDKNRHQLLIPAGCANGHLCLTDQCIFSYKQSEYYSGAENQFTIRWNDPSLNLYWPIKEPLISARDASAPLL